MAAQRAAIWTAFALVAALSACEGTVPAPAPTRPTATPSPSPSVVEDYVDWLSAAYSAEPPPVRRSLSLGFIGDARLGRHGKSRGSSIAPWWRPFPGDWTGSYEHMTFSRGARPGRRP
jgi:hypothetical protein